MVIYKRLFQERDKFSGSEAIVYSTLVNLSLLRNGEVFGYDGKFDHERAIKYINSCKNSYGCAFIELTHIKQSSLAQIVNESRRNIQYILKSLHEKSVLFKNRIYCPELLIEDGYLKLAENTSLKGWQLVFYSLIKERASYFGGKIDTYAYRLAELFNATPRNVYSIINILKSKGYIYRDSNGNIVVK